MKPIHIVLALLAAIPLSAQRQSFTIEQVMSSPFPTNLTAAGKASRIAWTFNSKGERNVWIAEAPGFTSRQVTHYRGDDGQDIFSLRLTADGKTAVYARGSELNREGNVANATSLLKEPKQQVWAIEVERENVQSRLLGDMGCPQEDCEDIQRTAKNAKNHRIADEEKTTYSVSAILLGYRQEGDGDFHLVLEDPANPASMMIAEIPDPGSP